MKLLNKEDVIQAAKEVNPMIDEERRIYFKIVDHSDNPIAPETVSYRFLLLGYMRKTSKILLLA